MSATCEELGQKWVQLVKNLDRNGTTCEELGQKWYNLWRTSPIFALSPILKTEK